MEKTAIIGLTIAALMLGATGTAHGSDGVDIDCEAALVTNVGSGDFAPYYLNANRHGMVTQSADALIDLKAVKKMDLGRRLSYDFGVEAYGGWSEATAYERYSTADGWTTHDVRPKPLVLQQLYAALKWRGVYLSAGMRNHESALLNFRLSSGDLIESGNARSVPEVRVGFIDFQDIPFTNGWVQLQGEVSYGKFTDGDWWSDHYNYYNYHITRGSWLNYKRWYFRTKPSQPLSVTVGAQCVNVFGGTSSFYNKGELSRESHYSSNLGDFFEAFLPIHNREDFRYGNTIGSWDLKACYRLRSGSELSAYFQWPWEDGSGIGRRNGWDGLWGIEYKAPKQGWIDGAVIEYLDMTNQSGPLHWAPSDRPGTTITGEATGADDYYNSAYFNAYANYGLSIGTPMLKAPLFNTDGYPGYAANRVRGFHAAAEGHPSAGTQWRAAVGYRKAWGNGYVPMVHPQEAFSMMVEGGGRLPSVACVRATAALALDHGSLTGNNFGVQITITYTGSLSLGRHK